MELENSVGLAARAGTHTSRLWNGVFQNVSKGFEGALERAEEICS